MPQQVYTVEIDGQDIEIEGDRPPTEAEARQALQAYQTAGPQPLPEGEPDTYMGGFMKGLGEGVEGGARGFVEGVKNSPVDLVRSTLGLVTTNPVDTIKNFFTGLGDIPEAVADAGRDPQGWGEKVGSVAGQTALTGGIAKGVSAAPGAAKAVGRASVRNPVTRFALPYAADAIIPGTGKYIRAGQMAAQAGKKVDDVIAPPPPSRLRGTHSKLGGITRETGSIPTSSTPKTIVDELVRIQDELDSGPIVEADSIGRGYKAPAPAPIRIGKDRAELHLDPTGPNTRSGAVTAQDGAQYFSSDVESLKQDPKVWRKVADEAADTLDDAPPAPAPEVIKMGGQTVPPDSPLYQKLLELSKPGRTGVPPQQHPILPDMPGPVIQSSALKEVIPAAGPSIPNVRVKEWKPGHGPKPETIQMMRQEFGSRDAAKRLGIPQADVKKVGGSSRLPDSVRRTIDSRLAELKTPQQRMAYLDAAPNEMAREYIRTRLGL